MNSTVIFSSGDNTCFQRRCSTESILSIAGKKTDFVADTSDTESLGSDARVGVEFEPVTASEGEAPVFSDTSTDSEEEIIKTKVITVTVADDGDMEFADSERTDNNISDSEIDLLGFERCAQCHSTDTDSFYRYCQKCYKVRKNLFPPRPKRKLKRKMSIATELISRTLSQDSGFESHNSQKSTENDCGQSTSNEQDIIDSLLGNNVETRSRKRRATSIDRVTIASGYSSDSDSDVGSSRRKKAKLSDVQPLKKAFSEPVNVEEKIVDKDSVEAKDNMCIVCCVEPKSGVFAHGKVAHICCCYKCAVKVWNKAKRCPVCNCKVSNVLRAVVM